MPHGRRLEWLEASLAVGLGILFVYAALPKIRQPAEFAQAIKYYRILPLWAVNAVAIILPWCELLSGVALFIRRLRCGGAWLVGGMAAVFSAAVVSALVRGLDISCGCFERSSAAGLKTLALDAGIIVCAAAILWRCSSVRPGPWQDPA